MAECVARYDNKIIFSYHYADRRDVMRQSMLSKVTNTLTLLILSHAVSQTISYTLHTLSTPTNTSANTPFLSPFSRIGYLPSGHSIFCRNPT